MEGEELKNVVLSILEQQQQFFDYNKEQDPELTALKKEQYYAKRELDDLEQKTRKTNSNLKKILASKVVHEKELDQSQNRLNISAKEFEKAKEAKEALKAKIFTKEDPEYKTAKANFDQARTNVKQSEKNLDVSQQKVLQRESEVKECRHQLSRIMCRVVMQKKYSNKSEKNCQRSLRLVKNKKRIKAI
jgi:chromosome segregation ATPase